MTDRTQEAQRLLGEIRYQVYRPEVKPAYDRELTQERVLAVLDYDKTTGVFTWNKDRPGRFARAGRVAGRDDGKGYTRVFLYGRWRRAHRLAWLYVYGVSPSGIIDHIDGDTTNNRISNLRECTAAESVQNVKSKSKHPGATFTRGRWRAQISVNGVRKFLGHFDTAEEASQAYVTAKRELHSFNPEVRGAR